VEVTEEDRRVAALATELLHARGRPELGVSPEQVIRWRQVAKAIPVASTGKGGRSKVTPYLPTAPAVAAELAIVLAEGPPRKTLDQAVLMVFADAAVQCSVARPHHEGVRSAYLHHLQVLDNTARQAWKHKGEPRSSVPRRLRLGFAGSRKPEAYMVSDSLLACLLGEPPPYGQDGLDIALDEFSGVSSVPLYADDRGRLVGMLAALGLAALRRSIRKADLDLLSEAVRSVSVTFDYADAVSTLSSLHDGKSRPSLPGILDSLVAATEMPLFSRLRVAFPASSRSLGMALMGLVAYSSITRRRGWQQLRANVTAWSEDLPRVEASLALADDLPTAWRPALAPGSGAAFVAALPDQEREELLSVVRHWMSDHPRAAGVLYPEEKQAPTPTDP
jgi:hypothetical protein